MAAGGHLLELEKKGMISREMGIKKQRIQLTKLGIDYLKNEHLHYKQIFELTNEISISDVMKALNISRATAGRRLAKLTSQGRLIQAGEGKATRYRRNR